MRQRLRRAITALAAALCGTALLATPANATAADGPQLTVFGPLLRGAPDQLAVAGLQPGTSYTLSLDHGTFKAGTSTLSFTAPATDPTYQTFQLPASDPSTQILATLTATGDPTVLASLNVPVAPPQLILGEEACPGQPTTVLGGGFLPGSYLIRDLASSSPATLLQTSSTGSFAIKFWLPDSVADNFTVTATPDGGSTPVASATLPLSKPTLSVMFSDPWHGTLHGRCFGPGEQATLSSSGGFSVPASYPVGYYGQFYAPLTNRPDLQSSSPITLTSDGQHSHQQATLSVSSFARDVLLPGQLLQGSAATDVLASASDPGFDFEPNYCTAPIRIWQPGPIGLQWTALEVTSGLLGTQGCSLLMQTDGNAVLRSAAGYQLWSTGTHVAGSHLLLTNAGSLQIISPAGAVLWNSSIAPSRVSVASSRVHSVVYVNGLVQQRAPTAGLIRGAHRTVYLQRYLDGRWQNMLARTTDSLGQLAVGFVQPRVYQYRLVLLPTASAFGATSSSTFR